MNCYTFENVYMLTNSLPNYTGGTHVVKCVALFNRTIGQSILIYIGSCSLVLHMYIMYIYIGWAA